MTTLRSRSARALRIVSVLLACACDNPTRVVLSSTCDANAAGSAASSCDAGTTIAKCLKDGECPKGELCTGGACALCDQKVVCDNLCPAGSIAATTSVNGCPGCSCAATSCKVHSDCPTSSVCEKNLCVPCEQASAAQCPDAATCAWQWTPQVFKRNGCAICECAPPNGCLSDVDCGTGEHCYHGVQCHDGCNDLACCFGNFCSPLGCQDPPAVSCALVGCSDGRCIGDLTCQPQSLCKCDGKAFSCASGCGTASCEPIN